MLCRIPPVHVLHHNTSKGALKSRLGEFLLEDCKDTQTKVIFSNKGDYFPNTSLRVLGKLPADLIIMC
eukprot:6341656-Amphidinium_carterae.3